MASSDSRVVLVENVNNASRRKLIVVLLAHSFQIYVKTEIEFFCVEISGLKLKENFDLGHENEPSWLYCSTGSFQYGVKRFACGTRGKSKRIRFVQ